MFDPPRKLKHITKHFQALCDAVMDLNPQPIIGNIPDDCLECAHLIILAETAVVRECTNAAEELSNSDPIDFHYLVSAHHAKISNYLVICSLLLDTDLPDSSDDFDLKIF
jgi:hypothetical protein